MALARKTNRREEVARSEEGLRLPLRQKGTEAMDSEYLGPSRRFC